MNENELINVFKQDLNVTPLELFDEFNLTPIASASIGQVHKARTFEGDLVAVKVQYPKIVAAIKNDLKNVEQIKGLFDLLFRKNVDISPFIKELQESFEQECNYLNESQKLLLFKRSLFDKFPEIIIPTVYEKYTTKNILTMSFHSGDSFEKSLLYDQKTKDKLGETLLDSYLYSLYELGVIHSDPQNGNYLFNQEKIILLDFGSTRSIPMDFIVDYVAILIAIEENNYPLYKKTSVNLKLCQHDDDDEHFKKHYNLIREIYSPFLQEGEYCIDNKNPLTSIFKFFKEIKLKGRETPRREFLLMDRATFGHYTKLKKWKSKINWQEIKSRHRKKIEKKVRDKYKDLFKQL